MHPRIRTAHRAVAGEWRAGCVGTTAAARNARAQSATAGHTRTDGGIRHATGVPIDATGAQHCRAQQCCCAQHPKRSPRVTGACSACHTAGALVLHLLFILGPNPGNRVFQVTGHLCQAPGCTFKLRSPAAPLGVALSGSASRSGLGSGDRSRVRLLGCTHLQLCSVVDQAPSPDRLNLLQLTLQPASQAPERRILLRERLGL